MPGVSDQRLGREDRRKKTVFGYLRKVLPHGATVVVIFLDQADRYHSTEVFRAVCNFFTCYPILSS